MIDLAEKLKNEIYIISPHGESIAKRSPRDIDTDELKRIIRSFPKIPSKNILFAKYKNEPLLISLFLCRSSGFLVAAIPYCKTETVLGYIEASGCDDILVSDDLKNETVAKRISQEELDTVADTLSLMRMQSGTCGIIPKSSATELMSRVSTCTQSIAELVGCRIDVSKSVIFSECENFDVCFFEAFMLCFSMLVRRASLDRTAELGFFMTKRGLAIRVETECLPGTVAYELDDIRAFAENNGMYFSVSERKGILCVELCPHRPDLSKLGLKNNDIFLE